MIPNILPAGGSLNGNSELTVQGRKLDGLYSGIRHSHIGLAHRIILLSVSSTEPNLSIGSSDAKGSCAGHHRGPSIQIAGWSDLRAIG
jgi:hypothetical protein